MIRHYSQKNQQGMVIVVALFFVALIATMAYYMMSRLEKDTRRTQLLLRDVQAEYYAQGSIDWAMEQLRANLEKKQSREPRDLIPIRSPIDEVNGYKIHSVIFDMQARMNVNNLTDQEAQADFKRLLRLVYPELSEQKAQEIVFAIKDWITVGGNQNEFSKYYMSLSPPYRAAHKLMVSVSELQLIKGITPALYQALSNYITALPISTTINVQTAPAEVLTALSPTMTLDTGKAIEKLRAQKVIDSVQTFLNLDLIKNHLIPEKKITVISQFFLVETTVEIENQSVLLYTLLERSSNDSKNLIKKIWQSKSVPG